MSDFIRLICYEYKKILSKKSVKITLIIAIFYTALCSVGTLLGSYQAYESNYEGMIKDREYARALTGRLLDDTLINETVNAYKKIPQADQYQETPEYHTYARMYNSVYQVVRPAFNTQSGRFNMNDFQQLTMKEVEQFYLKRQEQLITYMDTIGMSDKVIQEVSKQDAKIKTPLLFGYTGGYTNYFNLSSNLGLTISFVLAICIAPIFCGEYTTGADQLILSSKYGKNRVIMAKLFTGFTLSAIISLVISFLSLGLSLAIYGADGSNAPLQLENFLCPYPLTMAKTAGLVSISIFLACLMTATIVMYLSARLKTPFGVIILVVLLLIVPMVVYVPQTELVIYQLFRLFPTQMMSLDSVTNLILYDLFGLIIKPYVFLPMFSTGVCVALTPIAYQTFKKHQVR